MAIHRQSCLWLWLILCVATGTAAFSELPLVRPHGFEFSEGGRSFRFVGFNIRGIVHYGHGAPLAASTAADIDANLAAAASAGARVIRFFAAKDNVEPQETVNRIKVVLDKMEPQGLRAVVCLTDLYYYPWSPFHPKGDDKFYADRGGFNILTGAFFSGGFRENYLPFVELAVTQLKNHPAIFAWELGNELKDPDTPLNIMPFVKEVAAKIKSIDPHHMVSTGFMNWDHQGLWIDKGVELYSDPNIDIITHHQYDLGNSSQNDAIYSRVGKPLVVEEFGFQLGDRPTFTRQAMEKWFGERQAQGFMNWGFQGQTHDIGDGDSIFGIDPYHHTGEYPLMIALYHDRATSLGLETCPLPAKAIPQGRNVAPQSMTVQTDSVLGEADGYKAIDGVANTGSKWTTLATPGPHWLALDLGRTCLATGFVVRMAGIDDEIGYNFKQFEIQLANSLAGPWTTLVRVENPAQFCVRVVMLDSPTPMRFVRLLVTHSGIDSHVRLHEFEVYETPAGAAATWLDAAGRQCSVGEGVRRS